MKHNIYTRKYFYPLTNQLECYRSKFTPNHTPVAQNIAQRILTLPLYAKLQLDAVDKICTLIKTQFNSSKATDLKESIST